MPKEAPFDVWDGEDLETVEVTEVNEVEEIALHVDPDSLVDPEPGPHWSDLTDASDDDVTDDAPVSYFEDEQPEAECIIVLADDRDHAADRGGADDEGDEVDHDDPDTEPDLEELLERQHYAFPDTASDNED